MSTPTSLTPSAARAPILRPQSVAQAAVDAQQTLVNRLAEKLGVEPGSLNGKRADYTPEKVAGRILDFIGQRLEYEAANGADTTRLEKVLKQTQEGVEKGFAEARAILDGMGVLKGQVAADIDDTYKRIQAGFTELNNRFGTSSQTPAPVAGGSNVAAYNGSFEAQAESFDLSITTRDGDRLKISIAHASSKWSTETSSSVGTDSQSNTVQIGSWQVEVEGELDDEERVALEKLFDQVQDISSKFYTGDLNGAFDRALALDIDGEQLASMSLQLTQTKVRQSTDAYSQIAEQGGQMASVVNNALMDYTRSLLESLRTATDVSADPKNTLESLLAGANSINERFDTQRSEKAEELNQRLLGGLQNLLPSTQPSQV